MKAFPRILIAFAIVATAVSASAKVERDVDKTFTVSGTGTIRLETSGGSITLHPGADGVVKITAHERIRASSDAEADELLKHLELTFDQAGNDVSARAKYEQSSFGFHFGSWPPVQVDFDATVPAAYVSDLHTSGGSITVGDLNGAITGRTSGGSITIGKAGSKVDVRTSGGNISVQELRGDSTLETSGGNISVGLVGGETTLSTSGGGIRLDRVEQAVRAHTSGGSIRAGFVGALKGNCSLSTSGGSVHVSVDKKASFHLDAATSGGGVDADGLTIALTHSGRGRDKLNGDVNGGGPELKLRTSGGSVVIEAR